MRTVEQTLIEAGRAYTIASFTLILVQIGPAVKSIFCSILFSSILYMNIFIGFFLVLCSCKEVYGQE